MAAESITGVRGVEKQLRPASLLPTFQRESSSAVGLGQTPFPTFQLTALGRTAAVWEGPLSVGNMASADVAVVPAFEGRPALRSQRQEHTANLKQLRHWL